MKYGTCWPGAAGPVHSGPRGLRCRNPGLFPPVCFPPSEEPRCRLIDLCKCNRRAQMTTSSPTHSSFSGRLLRELCPLCCSLLHCESPSLWFHCSVQEPAARARQYRRPAGCVASRCHAAALALRSPGPGVWPLCPRRASEGHMQPHFPRAHR